MLISDLNRFFARHGRKAFALITGVIIVSFVLYFSPGFDLFSIISGKGKTRQKDDGPISQEEYRDAVNNIILVQMLNMPFASLDNEYSRKFASYQAPERVIIKKTAMQRGIHASDPEVVKYLMNAPSLQKDGVFSKEEYENFVKEKLVPFRLDKQALDNAVRDQIIVDRLENEVKSGALLTDKEIRTAFQLQKEKYKVRDFRYNEADFEKDVKKDEESVKSFFNANRDEYKIPVESKVHLVRFNHIDYENEAKKAITQDEIAAHYEKNKNKYKEKDEIPPLEKVIDRVKSEIAESKCREKAMDDAHAFAEKAYDLLVRTADGKVLLDKFKAMAEEQKLVNMETDWIRKGENEIKRVGNEPALVAETAILTYESPVSNPTSGNKAAFVALLKEQRPERPAEFDEVKDQVEKDFIKEKALILSREKARNDALAISNALKSGKTFQEIEKDFKSEDVPEFTADSGPSVKDSSTISELSKETRANSVSETRETPTGAIFVLVEKITPPTDEDFEKEKVKFSDEYKRRKEDVVWNNFLIKVFEAFQPPKEDKEKAKVK